jgi:recombination protein RecA
MTKTVDDVLAEFEKKTGLKIGPPDRVTGMPTGNIAIDWQSGVGGLPVGRITELYGYESSGKTTTALQTAATLQPRLDAGQRIVYLDFEHALDTSYTRSLGVDIDASSFVPVQPNNLEQGANAALSLMETGQVPLIVFDSVAAMSPKRLKEGDFDQATIQMHRAKLISALCQSMLDTIWTNKVTVVFVNHKMESVEMTGRPGLPPKVTTPGGRGLKYYASLRLEFDVGGGVKDKISDFLTGEETNQLIGNKVYVKCVKNKVGEPGKVVELRSRYGMGFDNFWSALQVLIARKMVNKSGAWYTFKPDKLPSLNMIEPLQLQGEQAVLDKADNDQMWRAAMIEAAWRAIRGELVGS